ncbi:hypothetical protein ACLKA6_010827 [Drosophila palustris]
MNRLPLFPEYQEKAFEEILALFPHIGYFEVSNADTQQMVYLDLILNESMRVIPPVPLLARQTSQDMKLSNGVVILKGLQILINLFHLHRSKEIWGSDAETFNPDSFLPFLKGIRNCLVLIKRGQSGGISNTQDSGGECGAHQVLDELHEFN